MNGSNVEHLVIAIGIQLVLYLLPGSHRMGIWGTGGVAVALFIGREIAQNEYWWAAHYHGWHYGQPLDVPWYAGVLSPHWHLDSVLDIACPLVGCVVVALLAEGWKRRKRTA